jgi:hypothetical protein
MRGVTFWTCCVYFWRNVEVTYGVVAMTRVTEFCLCLLCAWDGNHKVPNITFHRHTLLRPVCMSAEKHISLQMNQFIYGMLDRAPSLAPVLREFLPTVIKLFSLQSKKEKGANTLQIYFLMCNWLSSWRRNWLLLGRPMLDWSIPNKSETHLTNKSGFDRHFTFGPLVRVSFSEFEFERWSL